MASRLRLTRQGLTLGLTLPCCLLTACPLTTFEVEPAAGASGNAGALGGSAGTSGGLVGGSDGGPAAGSGNTTFAEPEDDRYIMVQGESLVVSAAEGLLANDSPHGGLTVIPSRSSPRDPEFDPSFVVFADGEFEFGPPPSFFGRFFSSYSVISGDGARASASVEVLVVPSEIELDAVAAGIGGFVLNGAPGDALGFSLANAADVNSDGLDDILVGAPAARTGAGAAYVVFGKRDPDAIDLEALPARASERRFISFSGRTAEALGVSLSSAGDLDGNGGAELLIGANGGSGRAYVVFAQGLWGGTTLPGARSYTLEGDSSHVGVGRVVRGVGDLNRDGVPDVLVSSRSGSYGFAHLVFGSGSWMGSATVADAPGFHLRGARVDDGFPLAAAGAGDVNGDRFPELFLASNISFVLLLGGRSYPADVGAVSSNGELGGWSLQRSAGATGASLTSAGDVDGDGVPDVAYCDGLLGCRVVFGAPSTLASAWKITGFSAETSGLTVAGGGDLDADGLDDLVFAEDGRAHVVYGKRVRHTDLNLSSLGNAGYSIAPERGGSVSTAVVLGDVNGDEVADFALGDASANAGAGRVYVVFGVATR